MKYSELASIYEALESTSKRLEKTYLLSKLLKKTKEDDIDQIVLLIQGRLFPQWDETKMGVSDRLVIKAINIASGNSTAEIEQEWKKLGDLGLVAEKLVGKKTQATLFSKDLTVDKVYDNLRKLPTLEGHGSVDQKIKLIAELLSSAKPLEARYVVRTVLEDLRVGVGSGSIRDALVWAFFGDKVKVNYNQEEKKIEPENREEYKRFVEAVQHALDLTADYGIVAKLIMKKGEKAFGELTLEPGNPINVMLYQKAKDLKDAFERVGKPCAIEFKYDGFRMQIHKKGKSILIFTRRLDNVTNQFPEVVKYAEQFVHGKNFIIDCEAVGFNPKSGKYLPFQSISQRIRRKHNIDQMAKDFPVEINVFDIMLFEGKSLLKEPFKARRAILEKIIKPHEKKLVIARQIITDNLKEADNFYKEALKVGEEGVMAKNLDGIYKPGSRVGYGVKVKPVMESLDLVIVGAEWGSGKRSGWLTSYVLACRKGDKFEEIGKVGTGIKELEEQGVSFEQLTNLLKPLIISEEGKVVRIKPEIIIEVKYEEIQKSPTYESGYALRFPRFIRLREDKALSDVSGLGMVEELYAGQKK
ncbi:MAG: ATP-dependent DNA ligase [Nanoarchaeota archaeon]|nr:ATP-dependent DNA ligase [Nanoarchaeota archaeon]MBU1321334.1 ATP-dependent DNA ligase [Nanoarchaeota archaeon]MBU1597257.1 ATP-dependent DNA ligase [Nanoarchaeota archaeon]MBU2441471.1 ATP-dependent DNA ligase [Nanoarchaeota archaeon]